MRAINSINVALRNIKNTFGSNSNVYNHVLDTLSGIENLELTKGSYISKKTKDNLALQAADNTVKNVTRWFDYTKRVIEDNNADAKSRSEMMDIPDTKAGLIKATNVIVRMFDEYGDALDEFYDIEEEILGSAIDISNDERNYIRGLVADIRISISHPGQWALPANRISQNENKIDNLKNQWNSAKERQNEDT